MKDLFLKSSNIDSIVKKINEITNGKTYWLGLGFGDYSSVDDPHFNDRWFSNYENFDRLFFLTAHKDKSANKIIISHKSANENKKVTPEYFEITPDLKISSDKNDIIIFNKSKMISDQGGSTMYMEYTMERNQKYKK